MAGYRVKFSLPFTFAQKDKHKSFVKIYHKFWNVYMLVLKLVSIVQKASERRNKIQKI